MFERPNKNDLDKALSMLMHESRHKLMEEVNGIKSDAIKAGALQSIRVVVTAVSAADNLHQRAMEQAQTILLDFIERMERPPTEVVAWARPHLENFNNSVLGVVPPNGFPQDYQRLTHQYRAVFQQRLDIMLRNVEIGHQKGAGFARAEKVESKEEWISAAAAVQLLKPVFKSEHVARITICQRAHAGLIRARAERFMIDDVSAGPREVPKEFRWAEGHEALDQNWVTGDFETWIDQKRRLRAFDVSFLRVDIEKMIPADLVPPPAAPSAQGEAAEVISWDTAMSESELSDYSVATVWAVKGDHCYLIDVVRERFNYPGLKRAALELGKRYPDAITLIEEKSSGVSLIQDLRDEQVSVIGIKPETDKVTRLCACAPQFESGSVFFPGPEDKAPWLNDLVAELLAFPGGKHDDQVDSISQALTWVRARRRAPVFSFA